MILAFKALFTYVYAFFIFWHFNVGYEFKLFSAHSKLLKVKAAHFASLLGVLNH